MTNAVRTMPGLEPWNPERGRKIIAAHTALDGAALPILHALQGAFGYIPEDAIPMVADALNLSRAEVFGVVTFYHDFRREKPGRHVLKLCRAEACQSMGGEALAEHAHARLQTEWGRTSVSGAITVEPVFCLGLCACAPAALLDGRPIGRLDAAKLDALLGAVRSGA